MTQPDTPPVFSIMMPAYNAQRFIAQAVTSALQQSFPSFELIVVDDGSTDGTAEIVNQFSDPRIRLIHRPNGGEAAARNTALEHVRGTYLAFLDADDAYLPEHLAVAFAYLHSHPDRDAVYGDGYHCDRAGARLQPLSSRRRGPFEGRIFEQVIRASDVFGPPLCIVLRHAVIARHGLRFDTGIGLGTDWDFLARYADLATFGYTNERTCLYRIHQTNMTVVIDPRKRMMSWSKCRERAIKMPAFNSCSLATRSAVFYDLLINLLWPWPERQAAVTDWPEFRALPAYERARLFRLMASQAILHTGDAIDVCRWLRLAADLDRGDPVAAALGRVYVLSPSFCRTVLRLRRRTQLKAERASTYAGVGE